jgi:hypothetical protein
MRYFELPLNPPEDPPELKILCPSCDCEAFLTYRGWNRIYKCSECFEPINLEEEV